MIFISLGSFRLCDYNQLKFRSFFCSHLRCRRNTLSSSLGGKEEQEECWHTKQQRKGKNRRKKGQYFQIKSSTFSRPPSSTRALQEWPSSSPCYRIRPSSTGRTTPCWNLASSSFSFPHAWSQCNLRHNPSCAEALLSSGVSTNNKEFCEKTFLLVYNLSWVNRWWGERFN